MKPEALQNAQLKEHDAWIKIWATIKELTGKTSEELNKPEWRVLAADIERWGYYDLIRRIVLRKEGDEFSVDKGLFWKGDEQ